MSWIDDVKYELDKLDLSLKSLKKFGLTIGIIFIIVSLWMIFFNSFSNIVSFALLIAGSFLFINGMFFQKKLASIYKFWMGIAFVLGWFVSRILLSIIFAFLITPIALIAKLFSKSFLSLSFDKKVDTYWIKKENSKINYKKMY